MRRVNAICGIFGALLFAGPIQAQSPAERIVAFDVPSQSLSAALTELAAQSNLRIVFDNSQVKGRTERLVGTYTPRDALEKLLSRTELKYEFIDERTVEIRPAQAPARSSSADVIRMRVAQDTGAHALQIHEGSQTDSQGRRGDSSDVGEDQASPKLDEIIVTAQKRQERLIDVPISIVAMGAGELEARRIKSIDELSMVVPGLATLSNGGYLRRIQLRGVSNISGNASLIGQYLDEASVTSAASSQLDIRTYDLERVEVLRGPQGTLYGDGSAGGTIRFITRNPVLDRFGASADAAAAYTQDGAPSQRIEGMLNVPVVENKFGLRIAGVYDHAGGWIDQPAAGRDDFNGQNMKDVRIKALWQPAPQFALNTMAVVHRNNGSNNNNEAEDGTYTQVLNLTTTPRVEDDYDLYNLTLTYDFSAVRLLSTSGYVQQNLDMTDYGGLLGTSAPGTAQRRVYQPLVLARHRTATEELRLTSLGSGPWQWTLGGFYRRNRVDQSLPYYYVAFEGPPGTPLPAPITAHLQNFSESRAVFADSSYRVTERVTLGAGLRYFEDDQEATDFAGATFQSGRFDALSPRIYAQYKLTDHANAYASIAEGFRSGGFNRLNQPPFDPEHVRTYELGAKTSLADGRLSGDVAVYYSDYTDYQIAGLLPPPAPTLYIYRNAGSARIKGVEWAFAWRPAAQWELSFNGDYLTSEFYEINVLTSAYQAGDQVDYTPKYQFHVAAQRDFGWNGKAGFARVDYGQRGVETYRNRSTGPWFYSESDVINMLNFNLGLQWNKGLSVGLFGQNLLNDRGYLSAGSNAGLASRARPRTYGVEFGVKFD